MKNNLISTFVKLALILLISTNVYSGGDDKDSLIQETLDIVLVDEYKPCSDQSNFDSSVINTATSLMLLSGDAIFTEGDEIIGSNNTRAIVSSYSIKTNELMYYQTAKTGFKSFLIGEKITSTSSDTGVSSIKEFVNDFIVPCSELIVSIEEDPQQMVFIFADSAAAIKAKIAAQEMMAEVEAEMARQAALEAFQQKLADEKAAAAKFNAAYQSKLANDAKVAALMEELAIEQELKAFEAKLKAELVAQEMMAEVEAEMARQAALEAFQQKLADEKAAAAKFNAAYQSKLANDAKVAALMEELAIEQELKAFEAKLKAELVAQEMMAEVEAEMARQAALLAQEATEREIAAFEAELAKQLEQEQLIKQARLQQDQMIKDRQVQLALERELVEFEAQLEADLASEAVEREIAEFEAELANRLGREEAELAAQKMMAEVEAEMAKQASLEAFQQKLADEKAAAAASTAAYQAKVAYHARIDKILQDLVVKLEEVIMPEDYKSILVEELIEEAVAKLEAEKFIGAISGEIVTVAIHEFCKENLNLSDSNIELFKKALAGGYLGNVGPQIDAGTEFTANRWDKYITCVGFKGN